MHATNDAAHYARAYDAAAVATGGGGGDDDDCDVVAMHANWLAKYVGQRCHYLNYVAKMLLQQRHVH